MSDYIPFDIQSHILQRLPVKSLVQFRSVSKQWKSFIEDPEFIKTYHINHTNPQHHLLVSYKLDDTVKTYTSIIDNNTFPQQKFPLTAPDSLRLLRKPFTLGPINGLLCFCGYYSKTQMAVIWNPAVRKSVGILIPEPKVGIDVVGFGVCPNTSDPKLVKITVGDISDAWVVEVFTLSTRVWKTVYIGAPFKSCVFLKGCQVFVNGVIYFLENDFYYLFGGGSNYVISFDLKSEKFEEVRLPERLVHTTDLELTKVNGSLGLLEYHYEGRMEVCGVWSRKNQFTKIYTIMVEDKSVFMRVLGFRYSGEVVMKLDAADNYTESRIGVYEPLSGRINYVGINGKRGTLYACSYMETLLLLDEPHSIIH